MKKIIMIMLFALLMTGCAKTMVESSQEPDISRFKVVEDTTVYWVLVDKETRVMYAVSRGGYNIGTFTLLVDADGNPLIYDPIQKNEL